MVRDRLNRNAEPVGDLSIAHSAEPMQEERLSGPRIRSTQASFNPLDQLVGFGVLLGELAVSTQSTSSKDWSEKIR